MAMLLRQAVRGRLHVCRRLLRTTAAVLQQPTRTIPRDGKTLADFASASLPFEPSSPADTPYAPVVGNYLQGKRVHIETYGCQVSIQPNNTRGDEGRRHDGCL